MPKGKKGLAVNLVDANSEAMDTLENEIENDFVEKKVKSTASGNPSKKIKGRSKKEKKVADPSNGDSNQNGTEELQDDASVMSDKNSSKPSEDDKSSNQESGEGSENVPEVNGEDEAGQSEDMPKKRGGKNIKKAGGRRRKPASSKEAETDENKAEDEAEETEIVPKKRGKQQAVSKEDETDNGNKEQSVKDDDDSKPGPQKPASRRGRQRKAAVEVKSKAQGATGIEEDGETEVVSKRGRRNTNKDGTQPAPSKAGNSESAKGTRGGRKRKNPPSDIVEEESYEELNAKDLEEATNVKVSIERQQDIDDMALELMESEGKVKTTAGSSGKGRGRKRGGDDESAGSSKKSKAAPSKAASKKEKIPDVSALDFDNKSTDAKGKSWNLKIATWNVNGLRAWIEKDGMSYLTHEDPDILCIQETKCSEDKLPSESNPVGYHSYWVAGDKDGYSGVGLMSKKKPLSVEYGIRKKVHDGEGRVITAEYDDYYLVATYVPNAGRKLVRLDYRKQWDIDFRAYLKKLDKIKPVILCGDLNVAHNEIDLANPKTNKKNAGFTQEERDGFSSLLSEGFVDAFRHLYPDTKDAYTFWTYLSNARAKNVGWRLDYFVLSERFTDNLCDCVIRKDVMGSDHCPLVLFLRI